MVITMYVPDGKTSFVSLPLLDSYSRQASHNLLRPPHALTPLRSQASTALHVVSNVPDDLPLVPLVVIAAVTLLITSQSWINFLLKGDQGLGAFLSDGSGYNKSGFRTSKANEDKDMEDPLPWLKLPQFDYVDVAGQPKFPQNSNDEVVLKMEALKDQMKVQIDEGDLAAAKQIEVELETLMEKEGYEFMKSLE